MADVHDERCWRTDFDATPGMDEQTRQAHFESMRKPPGLHKAASNRKLFVVHKDLQKQCEKQIKQHELDKRIHTAEIRQRQVDMQRRYEKLLRQQKRFESKRQKTHIFLEQLRQSHVDRETVLRQFTSSAKKKAAPSYTETIKSISKMAMPSYMKERLRHQFTVNTYGD